MTHRPTGDDALAEDPFAWQVTKSGVVLVSRGGRHVVAVGGSAAAKLVDRLQRSDDAGAQQLLARATGNYKRGTERR